MKDREEPRLLQSLSIATNILTVLSKTDSLLVFLMAKEGISRQYSKLDKDLEFSEVDFSRILAELKNCHLIERTDNKYTQTILGNLISQSCLSSLLTFVESIDGLKWIDRLRRTHEYSDDQIEELVRQVVRVAKDYQFGASRIVFVWGYEKSLSKLVEIIRSARTEIFIATRIMHEKLVEATLDRLKAGVAVKVIVDKNLLQAYINDTSMKMQETDLHLPERRRIVTDPWYPQKISRRMYSIPFGLVVVDGREAAVELIDQNDRPQMTGGLHIRDRDCCNALAVHFLKMWDQGTEFDPELVWRELMKPR